MVEAPTSVCYDIIAHPTLSLNALTDTISLIKSKRACMNFELATFIITTRSSNNNVNASDIYVAMLI